MKMKKVVQRLNVRLKDFDEMVGRLKSSGRGVAGFKRPGSLQRH